MIPQAEHGLNLVFVKRFPHGREHAEFLQTRQRNIDADTFFQKLPVIFLTDLQNLIADIAKAQRSPDRHDRSSDSYVSAVQ